MIIAADFVFALISHFEGLTMISHELHAAYNQLCKQLQPNTFITLATNQHMPADRLKKNIGAFFGRMDRWYLGHTWLDQPKTMRTDGIGFIEHSSSNIHAHMLVRFEKGNNWGRALKGKHFWNQLCESGSIDVQPVNSIENLAGYCTKEMRYRNYDDCKQIVLLRDFMPA